MQKLALMIVIVCSSVVQASPIKRLSNYDRLINGARNLAVKIADAQQAFVVKGKTTLGKIGRGTAVGSLNVLAVACLTSFALDGCRITDNQQVVGAISNYSQGRVYDQRFSQLNENNYLSYHLLDDGNIGLAVVDETTSTVETVKVQALRNYWSVLDLLEPEFSSTWDNRLVENGAVLARLLWHRQQTVSWDRLGQPLVAGGLTETREVNLSPDNVAHAPEMVEGTDGKLYSLVTAVNMMQGQTIAVFGERTPDIEYLVLINRISTKEGSVATNFYVVANERELLAD